MNLLLLTCKNSKEADKISERLLSQKLIVCAKNVPISSSYLWNGKIEKTNEALLIMDSEERLFTEIEKEVRKIHNYETFVLQSLRVNRISRGISKWLKEELKNGKRS